MNTEHLGRWRGIATACDSVAINVYVDVLSFGTECVSARVYVLVVFPWDVSLELYRTLLSSDKSLSVVACDPDSGGSDSYHLT